MQRREWLVPILLAVASTVFSAIGDATNTTHGSTTLTPTPEKPITEQWWFPLLCCSVLILIVIAVALLIIYCCNCHPHRHHRHHRKPQERRPPSRSDSDSTDGGSRHSRNRRHDSYEHVRHSGSQTPSPRVEKLDQSRLKKSIPAPQLIETSISESSRSAPKSPADINNEDHPYDNFCPQKKVDEEDAHAHEYDNVKKRFRPCGPKCRMLDVDDGENDDSNAPNAPKRSRKLKKRPVTGLLPTPKEKGKESPDDEPYDFVGPKSQRGSRKKQSGIETVALKAASEKKDDGKTRQIAAQIASKSCPPLSDSLKMSVATPVSKVNVVASPSTMVTMTALTTTPSAKTAVMATMTGSTASSGGSAADIPINLKKSTEVKDPTGENRSRDGTG